MGHITKSATQERATDRFSWMEHVLGSAQFTDAEARVLVRLALHQNLATGRIDVGIETLADEANQKPRKTIATIAKAEHLGWITRAIGGGRAHTNSYSLVLRWAKEPCTGVQGLAAETLHAQVVNPACPGRKPCTPVQGNSKNRKNRAAEAARCAAGIDEERDYFRRGKQVLGSNSGGLLAHLRRHKGGNIALARAAVEYASTKQNPREYVCRILAGQAEARPEPGIIDARRTGII
jgi:hypothetical protein